MAGKLTEAYAPMERRPGRSEAMLTDQQDGSVRIGDGKPADAVWGALDVH